MLNDVKKARFTIMDIEEWMDRTGEYATLEAAKKEAEELAAENGETVIVLQVVGGYEVPKSTCEWREF